MKQITLIIAIGAMAIGRLTAQDMVFDKIKLSGVLNAVLVQGDNCSVKVENDNDKTIKYSVVGGVLSIEGSARKTDNKAPSVTVVVKSVSSINVEGVVNLSSSSEISSDVLTMNVEGVVNMDLNLKANKIIIEQESIGNTTLKGSAQFLDLDIEGVGSFSSKELIASDVKVRAEGIGSVEVYAKDKLRVSNDGIGSVEYFGNPPVVERLSKDFIEGATEKMKRDTTKLKWGQQRIMVYKDTTGRSYKKLKNKNTPRPWKGIGLSMDGYTNKNFNNRMAPGFEFLEQNYAKSIGFHWNFWEKDINLYQKKLRLITGLGFEWNRYALKHDVLLNRSRTRTAEYQGYSFNGSDTLFYNYGGFVNAISDSSSHKSTKLRTSFINVPLLLQYNYMGSNNKPASISAGVILGARMGVSNKIKYDNYGRSTYSGAEYNQLLSYKCDATVRISKKRYTAFCDYSLTRLFYPTKGPRLYPFSIGFNYRIFKGGSIN